MSIIDQGYQKDMLTGEVRKVEISGKGEAKQASLEAWSEYQKQKGGNQCQR